jgi:uncharacterized protein
MSLDRVRLVDACLGSYSLELLGIHGPAHWARVRLHGLVLARRTGADPLVVELFAWLHDTQRENDGHDPEHGLRAAALARQLEGDAFELGAGALDDLLEALSGHSEGRTRASVSVQTCWDADRLDLGRIGIRPRADRLCTDFARDPRVIEGAWSMSRRWVRRMYGSP